MKRALALSVVDQGVLSVQSVAFGFLIMRLADAESVGRFALALAAFYIFLAVQNALIGTPLMTQVYGRPADQQERILRTVCTFGILILAAAFLGTAILLGAVGFTLVEILAAIAMVVTGLLREAARTIAISAGNMRRCLTVDATAVAISFALILPLDVAVPAEIACLLALAAGNAAAIALWNPPLHMHLRETLAALRAYRPYFGLTRWSLAAAVAAEIQTRAFLFVVEVIRSTAATGLIQVGRFLASPLSLVAVAWGRVVVPRMSAHYRNGSSGRALRIMYGSMAGLSVVAITYFAVIYLAWDWLEHYLFQDKYPGLGHIVLGWCVYTVVSEPVRCLTWSFQAMQRFRELAHLAVANAAIVMAFMAILVLPVPLYTTLAILTAGQLVVAAVLVWMLHARPRLREAVA